MNRFEEMKGVSFKLIFPGPEGAEKLSVQTFSELANAMRKHLTLPSDSFGYEYMISVLDENGKHIEQGDYFRHTSGDIDILYETRGAQGLNDALYEYERSMTTGEKNER